MGEERRDAALNEDILVRLERLHDFAAMREVNGVGGKGSRITYPGQTCSTSQTYDGFTSRTNAPQAKGARRNFSS